MIRKSPVLYYYNTLFCPHIPYNIIRNNRITHIHTKTQTHTHTLVEKSKTLTNRQQNKYMYNNTQTYTYKHTPAQTRTYVDKANIYQQEPKPPQHPLTIQHLGKYRVSTKTVSAFVC